MTKAASQMVKVELIVDLNVLSKTGLHLQEQGIDFKVSPLIGAQKSSAKKTTVAVKTDIPLKVVSPKSLKGYNPDSNIAELGFATRTINLLVDKNIFTVKELLAVTSATILSWGGVGKTVRNDIESIRGELSTTAMASPAEPVHSMIALSDIGLDIRAVNAFSKLGYTSLDAIANMSEKELRKVRYVSDAALGVISKSLAESGIKKAAPVVPVKIIHINKRARANQSGAPFMFDGHEVAPRTLNCLQKAGIKTVAQLKKKSDAELKAIQGAGKKVWDEFAVLLGRTVYQATGQIGRPTKQLDSQGFSGRMMTVLRRNKLVTIADVEKMTHDKVSRLKGMRPTYVEALDEIATFKKAPVMERKTVEKTSVTSPKGKEVKVVTHKAAAPTKTKIESSPLTTGVTKTLIANGVKFMEDLQSTTLPVLAAMDGMDMEGISEISQVLKQA
jgi:DNA-directed RNA polymerase alpha subunit